MSSVRCWEEVLSLGKKWRKNNFCNANSYESWKNMKLGNLCERKRLELISYILKHLFFHVFSFSQPHFLVSSCTSSTANSDEEMSGVVRVGTHGRTASTPWQRYLQHCNAWVSDGRGMASKLEPFFFDGGCQSPTTGCYLQLSFTGPMSSVSRQCDQLDGRKKGQKRQYADCWTQGIIRSKECCVQRILKQEVQFHCTPKSFLATDLATKMWITWQIVISWHQ